MSLIVLVKELTGKDIIKELGLYVDGSLQVCFVYQRFVNLINRQHGKQGIYIKLHGVVESRIMIKFLLFFTI